MPHGGFRAGVRRAKAAAAGPGVWASTYALAPTRFTINGQSLFDNTYGVMYTVTSYGARGSGSVVLTGSTASGSGNPDGWGVLYENGTAGGFQANTTGPRVFSMAPSGGSRGIGLVGYFGASFVGDSTKQPSYVLPA